MDIHKETDQYLSLMHHEYEANLIARIKELLEENARLKERIAELETQSEMTDLYKGEE